MIIAATIGHAGRPSRFADRGVSFEGAEEVSAVRRYLDAADRELRALGHTAVLLSDGDYAEAFACISGVKAVALCFEPYFLNGPRRAWLLANLKLVGQGLARGVDAWGWSR